MHAIGGRGLAVALALGWGGAVAALADDGPTGSVAFIRCAFENGSPLWWDAPSNGEIQVHLLYDHERGAPNRAAGHWRFVVEAAPGSDATLVLNHFDNVWNGRSGSPVSSNTVAWVSDDGLAWRPQPTEKIEGNRLRLRLHLNGPELHVARLEPYGLPELERLKGELAGRPGFAVEPIGRTVEGRELEMIRAGDPSAPARVLLRARAHPWEPGGNWVLEGLFRRLTQDDPDARQWRARFVVYAMPMANKDGVARGMTRFNVRGMDLNRQWDAPADPVLAPEKAAFERWIEKSIREGRRPHLAIDLHNDESGRLHLSRPATGAEAYLARMKTLEELLRRHTWFSEGSTDPKFRNPGSLGEGLLERYGIDACIHEFNANRIAKLDEPASRRRWEEYGAALPRVFAEYFERHPPAKEAR